MPWLLLSPIGKAAAAVAVVLSVLALFYWLGGRDGRDAAAEARDEIQTRERMDDAVQDIDRRDDEQIIEWLARRGSLGARSPD